MTTAPSRAQPAAAAPAATAALPASGSRPGGVPPPPPRWHRPARTALLALLWLALLWQVFALYTAGRAGIATGLLAVGAAALVVYGSARATAWKYLFPGVAGMLLFVAFPLLYTVQIGFTNYSSSNLLEQERARRYLLEQTVTDEARSLPFTVHADAGGGHRVVLGAGAQALVSPRLPATPTAGGGGGGDGDAAALPMTPLAAAQPPPALGPALVLREVVALRPLLMPLALRLPDGAVLRYAGLREFGPVEPLWLAEPGGALRRVASGTVYAPNAATGFFESPSGERVQPGFTVGIGFANYARMLLDADFRGPFVAIFVWTVAFAALTVLLATALGMALAVLLEWPALRGRAVYRTLLFLPYAVPGFISILVFKGLFNQNFGEINAILDALFGVRPAWFADPWLARAMLLVVNTWLGYPYIMILCTGLLKAIPADLYEASAIAGAGPLANFFRITAPLILRPLTPLLISAFAFNFNNFVIVSLLTDGRPDFLNTKLPAGTTDILVSYTYRIAFTDSGQNFGLAAAISTLIFGMVALMGLLQLRLTQRAATAAVAR